MSKLNRPKKGYVDTPNGQIHYSRFGDGPNPPLVMLHQTASSEKMYHAVMPKLAYDGPIYALDTPGFGGSYDLPEDVFPSMAEYAHMLEAAIDALGVNRFHLLGHHTGACIAVEIADHWPQRVASVSLIGPVPLTEEERAGFAKHYRDPIRPRLDGSHLMTTWEYVLALGGPEETDERLIHRETVDMLRAWWGRFQTYSAVWDQDFTTPFQRLQCPVLLMCAPGDVLMPFFGRAQELKPDAQAVTLKGANLEPDQDPEGLATALRSFIARIDADITERC